MKKMIMLSILVTSLSFYSKLYAANYGVGIGGYNLSMNSQNDSEGGTSTFSYVPGISLNAVWSLSSNHFFNPDIGYVFHLSPEDEYGDQSKKTLFVLWDLGYKIRRFVIRYGFGTFYTKIGGDGGAVTVKNGESSTTTAYKPQETITSYNTTIDLGLTFLATKNISMRAETYLFSFLSSEARTLHYSLTLHVLF
jgi:hypothetical protein